MVDHPLTKKPEDAGYEIVPALTKYTITVANWWPVVVPPASFIIEFCVLFLLPQMKEVHVSVEFVRNRKFRRYLDFSEEFLTIKEKKRK